MNPDVDRYIEQAAPFARPVLLHLRQLVHQTLPAVREQIKWGMPFFCLQHNLCFMAGFKAHCGFGFWRADALGLIVPAAGSDTGMGQFGKICSISDLPANAELQALLLQAADLAESPAAPLPRQKKHQLSLPLPAPFAAALQQNAAASGFFQQMTIAQQNDYIDWFLQAKTAGTQQKRLDTIVLWLAEHKTRNWKYMK
ncbi:MAG: YdeI/OmpD-associated family protein [Rheinheimera sp.]|nr:YdeI/OmpD-associated family protein [Rheinheimera sp.]